MSLALAKSNNFNLPWHINTKMLLTHTLPDPTLKVHVVHPLEQAHWVHSVLYIHRCSGTSKLLQLPSSFTNSSNLTLK